MSGFVLGLILAFITFNGLLSPWHLVGSPGEEIQRILGIQDGQRLIVETAAGKIYSLGFIQKGEVALSPTPVWKQEQQAVVDPHAQIEWGPDFIALPPLFQVEQLYEFGFPYKVEGKSEVRFVLTADGLIWMWDHQVAGLTGLVYYFYPVIGFLAGLNAAILILGINWLGRKSLVIQPVIG